MSIPSNPTPAGVFQAHFGAVPGTQDAKAECEKWERLCGELLAEREKLRMELEQARLEQIRREWAALPVPTMEEAYAQVERSVSIDDFIAEMKRELEAGR